MSAHLVDSLLYGHLWTTDELRDVFDERRKLASWLTILVALADSQVELGIIPKRAADDLRALSIDQVDLGFAAAETRRTGHSTLGFIRALQQLLPAESQGWVYYGATVQDLTDTWTSLAMRSVGTVVWRDLRTLEDVLLRLAEDHRDTVMAGRTHGQVGSPITLGFKAASWADELGRHLVRLRQGAPRWLVGQLAGSVGALTFFGAAGIPLRQLFCERLGLGDPCISWTSSRDRTAEFATFLAMVAGSLARIGNEVYQLQRPEIGELHESTAAAVVGSITMPHKQNPEVSEHLVTLSHCVRAAASVHLTAMLEEHERDGRTWKAEWVAFPEACMYTGAALHLCKSLVSGLQVNRSAMAANLGTAEGWVGAEVLLATLAPSMGKHSAQAALHDVFRQARESGGRLADVWRQSPLQSVLGVEALEAALSTPATGTAPSMVDAVISRARQRRASEPATWP